MEMRETQMTGKANPGVDRGLSLVRPSEARVPEPVEDLTAMPAHGSVRLLISDVCGTVVEPEQT